MAEGKLNNDRKNRKKSSEEQSNEDFMREIEELHNNLMKSSDKANEESESEEESNISNSDDESEVKIDHLMQDIEDLKEALQLERAKVSSLEEVINKQTKLIGSLKNTKQKHEDKSKNSKRCRYWNRGFCRIGDECKYYHSEEDCQSYMEGGICRDRNCDRRHRKDCRYFKEEAGCFRGESCEYLHTKKNKRKQVHQDKETNKHTEQRKTSQDKESVEFGRKVASNHNINSKYKHFSNLDTVSNFIFRLGLEEFANEYKIYFDKYGSTIEEETHVEKMIGSYGPEYILKHIK